MAPVSKARKNSLLSRLYSKTLSTPQKLLKEAKKTIPSLKIDDVKNFLHDQPNYLRTTKASYKKYPHSLVLRHIEIGQPFQQLLMDTWYLKKTLTTHFCFVIICGFTKFLWVKFSKDLNAASATRALKSVINSLPPNTNVFAVATDRGVEFRAEFSRYLASEDITHIFMTGPNKASIAERVIRSTHIYLIID